MGSRVYDRFQKPDKSGFDKLWVEHLVIIGTSTICGQQAPPLVCSTMVKLSYACDCLQIETALAHANL